MRMTGIISGRLFTGRGEAAGFTQLGWVRRQTIACAGIDPYPGTVNLQITDAASIAVWGAMGILELTRKKNEPERTTEVKPAGPHAVW